MKAPGTASCAPAKRPTLATPTKKPAMTRGNAGKVCSRSDVWLEFLDGRGRSSLGSSQKGRGGGMCPLGLAIRIRASRGGGPKVGGRHVRRLDIRITFGTPVSKTYRRRECEGR